MAPIIGCELICTDAKSALSAMDSDSVDLVFTSPPYEDARTYGIDFRLKSVDWVLWFADIMEECVRVCRGLVAAVVEGKTRNYAWSGTPARLMVELIDRGITLRKPPAFHRVGIPGSGGPDWLRNDYEFIVCATSGGRLPWSQPTAFGSPPKYERGGVATNRTKSGSRVRAKSYAKPKLTNPGNVIKCKVGGGHMGSPLAHDNEAPFPESLVEFFVKSFCKPGGTVLDPFCGSGTTCKVSVASGRNAIGVDIRESQVSISRQRLKEVCL